VEQALFEKEILINPIFQLTFSIKKVRLKAVEPNC